MDLDGIYQIFKCESTKSMAGSVFVANKMLMPCFCVIERMQIHVSGGENPNSGCQEKAPWIENCRN